MRRAGYADSFEVEHRFPTPLKFIVQSISGEITGLNETGERTDSNGRLDYNRIVDGRSGPERYVTAGLRASIRNRKFTGASTLDKFSNRAANKNNVPNIDICSSVIRNPKSVWKNRLTVSGR